MRPTFNDYSADNDAHAAVLSYGGIIGAGAIIEKPVNVGRLWRGLNDE